MAAGREGETGMFSDETGRGARHFAKTILQDGQSCAWSGASAEQRGQVMTSRNVAANVSFVGNGLGVMVLFMMPRDVLVAVAEGRGYKVRLGVYGSVCRGHPCATLCSFRTLRIGGCMRLSIAWLRGVLSQGLLGFVALSALAETAGATPVAVNWIPANGTVVAGSTLSRLGGTGFSDTAVGSLAIISGLGQLEFSTMETDRAKAAGLGSRDNNSGLQAIDFGFLLRADGTAAVIEKGAAVQSAGTYSAADLFKVAVEGSAIVFRVNGSLVRTSALAFTYPLFAEATLADPGATISNAELDGTTAEAVVWAGAVKTNASPGFLSKTTSATAWDASAISTMAMGPETDGYLEVSASLSPNLVMVGLSNGNTNSGYSDIDYALYMSSGTLYIYEGGTNRGSFGTFVASDKLRVSIESGLVKYRKNGTLVYTSSVIPTFPLLVDSSLYSSGARLTGAVLSGTLVQAAVSKPTFSSGSGLYPTAQTVTVTGETGSTIHYTTSGSEPTEADPVIASGASLLVDVDATLKAKAWKTGVYPSSTATAWYVFGTPTAENVDWTAHVNAASTGNLLSKTTGVVAWDAGAISTKGLGSPDGYLEVSANVGANLAMVGLSYGNTNSGYSDIDYALYFSSGTLYIYEGGLNRGSFGTVVGVDKLRVSVEGGVVRYRKNGILLYTSVLAPAYPLLVDSSLYSSGAMLQGAVLSGTLVIAAVQNPAFSVPSGIYSTAFDVVVTGPAGSTIHYTTNGLDPTEASATVVSGSTLLIDVTTTLKAKAFASGILPSGTTAAIYQFGTVSTEDVLWTAQVNTSSSGNALSKNTNVVAWDASAISTKGIISPGGYLEVSASLSPNLVMAGLSNGNTNSGYSDIDYALYLSAGTLYIYEGGINRGSFGTMVAADKLRVSVESGVVKYRKNGNLIYTSAIAPSYPLLVDTSLYSSGARLLGAVISGNLVQVAVSRPVFSPGSGLYGDPQSVLVTGEAGSTIYYTTDGAEPTEGDNVVDSGSLLYFETDTTLKAKAFATGLYPSSATTAIYQFGTDTTENVTWTAHVNATSTGNTLSKNISTTAWDASAVSTKAIDSPDGFLEVKASVSPKVAMVGLANGNTNSGFSDIDYALYMAAGTLYIYENGLNRGSFGTLLAADLLRVSVEGGVIKYRKNGNLLYTSAIAPKYPLLVDTSLYSTTAVVQGAVLSGRLVNSKTSPPTASPEAGGYALPLDVALSADPGATIRYTTDGSDPISTSTLYTTPINVAGALTIKARAARPGYLDSDVASFAYFQQAPGNAPTFNPGSGAYLGPLLVTAITSTPGGLIHYTINGSDPTEAGPAVSSGGVIVVPVSGILKGITFATGYAPSAVTSATYQLVTPAPVIAPAPGTYTSSVNVSITAVQGGFIYYTLDGQDPTPASTLYSGPFSLFVSATVKAKAFVGGWIESAVATATYAVQVADPVLSFPGGIYTTRRNVVATTATGGAMIHYTTNGQEPTASDASVASGGVIVVDRAMVLKVKAFKAGVDASFPVRADYMITGAVAFGTGFTLFLKEDGTVWSAGLNDKGQLGVGSTAQKTVPTQITETATFNSIKAIEAGDGFSLFLKEDGTVWVSGAAAVNGTGANVTSPVKITTITVPIVKIAAGKDHALALDGTGHVWTWGSNASGQLGTGNKVNRTAPCNPTISPCLPSLGSITAVAGGARHTLALLADGTIRAWGGNASGELGIGTRSVSGVVTPSESLTPTAVNLPVLAVRMVADNFHSLAISATGEVWSWGDNEHGGGGRAEPFAQVPAAGLVLSEQRLFAAGINQGYASSFTGPIWGFGHNQFGSLGDGTQTTRPVPGPTLSVPARYALESGYFSAGIISMAGEVYVWGLNGNGQLGLNNTTQIKSTPLRIPDPASPANPFLLVNNAWLLTDDDGDGLTAGQELMAGLDPYATDTNADGLGDVFAYALGGTATSNDPDGDGLPNAVEALIGTNPLAADTDGDGVNDSLDAYPLDPSRSVLGVANPNDHTPPIITLILPPNAQPIP